MAVKILHKRSAVEFKSATGAQLEFGELALNYHESGSYLQCKDAAGEIVQLGGVYIGADAPGNELKGAWWLRDTDFTLFLYDGTRWVSIAGGGGGGGTGDITEVIGGDGIEANELAGRVTVNVDLANNSHGLSFIGGKLQADIATTSSLGTVKIGDGIAVDAAGEISVDVDGIDIGVDLGYLPDGNNAGSIENSGGDDAVIPIVTDTVAGLMTGEQKQKLDGIEENAQPNPLAGRALSYDTTSDPDTLDADIATTSELGVVRIGSGLVVDTSGEVSVDLSSTDVGADLEYVPNGNEAAEITNTAGDNATVPIAIQADSDAIPTPTEGVAGLFTGLEKEKLAGIEDGAQVNGAPVTISDTAPTDPSDGDLWWVDSPVDEGGGRLYIYFEDDDTKQWIDTSLPGGGGGGGLTEAVADLKYLRIDAAAPDQTRVAGEATFAELTTHEAGVSMTGGVLQGPDRFEILTESSNVELYLRSDSGTSFTFNSSNGITGANESRNISSNFSGTGLTKGFTGITSAIGSDCSAGATGDVNCYNAFFNTPQTNNGEIVGYRSGVNNDDGTNVFNFYAAGSAPNYFEGLTEHAGGVEVTDGFVEGPRTRGIRAKVSSGTNRLGIQSAPDGNFTTYTGFNSYVSGDVTNVTHYDASQNLNATYGTVKGFAATGNLQNGTTASYGFWSDLDNSTGPANYNFYAEGNAPNYFAGTIQNPFAIVCSSDPTFSINPPSQEKIGVALRPAGTILSYLGSNIDAHHKTGRTNDGHLHYFEKANRAFVGSIEIDGGVLRFSPASDYRLKNNVNDLGSSTEIIKNLRPITYEVESHPGITHLGFIAHELQEHVLDAVSGTKDATEAIGTYTDPDGNVETDVTEPEAIPYGATWTETGTRDVYQGVDQTKLIPLLTKALQEVMQKNEDLEARIAALEGA